MKAADLRRIALALDGAIESAHMGQADFRAGGKIFATIHHDQKTGMVKLTPEQQQRLVRDYPGAFTLESGAWGRAGCTRVHFASVDEDVLGEALTLAWQNTAKEPIKKSKASRKR